MVMLSDKMRIGGGVEGKLFDVDGSFVWIQGNA
jgi:hypothetical protein